MTSPTEDQLLVLIRIHTLQTNGGTDPSVKQVYEGLPFKRYKADKAVRQLINDRLVQRVTGGNAKLLRLTAKGKERLRPHLTSSTSNSTPIAVSDDASAVRSVPVQEGPRPGAPSPPSVGGGSPLGSRLRKHRIKFVSPLTAFVTMDEWLLGVASGPEFSTAQLKGQMSFNWPKLTGGDDSGVGVQILVKTPKEPGVVEATVLWSVEDVFSDNVPDAECQAIEKLLARRRGVMERLMARLKEAREREVRKGAKADQRLFVSRTPRFVFGSDFRRAGLELASVVKGEERYVQMQGEYALEDNAMARAFADAGVSSAQTEKLMFDKSNGRGELDFVDPVTAPMDAQTYLEEQQRLFLEGGYGREQAAHRSMQSVLGQGQARVHGSMQDLLELQKLALMRDIQRGANTDKDLQELRQIVMGLVETVKGLAGRVPRPAPGSDDMSVR